MPTRVQRSRTAGWRSPLDAQNRPPVYVGRGTRWGNPWIIHPEGGKWIVRDSDTGDIAGRFSTRTGARAEAKDRYRLHLIKHPEIAEQARRELHGRDLMCWCPTPQPGRPDVCHGAVLLGVAQARTGRAA